MWPWILGAAVLVVALVVGGVFGLRAFLGGDDVPSEVVAADPTSDEQAPGPGPTTGASFGGGAETATEEAPAGSDGSGEGSGEDASGAGTTPGPELSPGESLQTARESAAQMHAEDLDEQWVVQLGSKRVGMEAEGRTWDEQAIWENYEQYQRKYPDAVLLWSGDWDSFSSEDFWVVVLATPHPNADSALAFCRAEGYDRDNCVAKHLFSENAPEDTNEYLDE